MNITQNLYILVPKHNIISNQWKQLQMMKKFQFPHFFKPIVGELSFQMNYSYTTDLSNKLATTRGLPTNKKIKQNTDYLQSKANTARNLQTLHNLNIVADSISQNKKSQMSNIQRMKAYWIQISNKGSSSTRRQVQRQRKVEFKEEKQYLQSNKQNKENKIKNKNKFGGLLSVPSNKVETQDECSSMENIKMNKRTSIEDGKSFIGQKSSDKIRKYQQDQQNKRQNKISQLKNLRKTKIYSKRNQLISSNQDVENCDQSSDLIQQQQNQHKIRLISQNIYQRDTHQNMNELELKSISTDQIDRQVSDRDIPHDNIKIRKNKRNNSILQINNIRKKAIEAKSIRLKRATTMHTLVHNIQSQIEQSQQSQVENMKTSYQTKTCKKQRMIKWLQKLNQTNDSSVQVLPKKHKNTKKVTFHQISSQFSNKTEQIEQKQVKPSIVRAKQKRKCIFRVKNSPSIQLSNSFLPEAKDNNSYKRYVLSNRQKKWSIPKKGSSNLLPLEPDVYNQLNLLLTRINQTDKDKAKDESLPNITISQPIQMTVSNKQDLNASERRQMFEKQNMMIKMGVKMTRCRKLFQRNA